VRYNAERRIQKKLLRRVAEGLLPPGLANWPADVAAESTDFVEL